MKALSFIAAALVSGLLIGAAIVSIVGAFDAVTRGDSDCDELRENVSRRIEALNICNASPSCKSTTQDVTLLLRSYDQLKAAECPLQPEASPRLQLYPPTGLPR